MTIKVPAAAAATGYDDDDDYDEKPTEEAQNNEGKLFKFYLNAGMRCIARNTVVNEGKITGRN